MKSATLPSRVSLGFARISLLLLTTYLAGLRLSFVVAAPDLDTDAYGHHIIARKILENPRDLGVHWVWLPLFHYVQALAIAVFGIGLDVVRMANVAVIFVLPWVVFEWHRRAGGQARALEALGISWVTAVLTALSPIATQMGTTGQPEPLFALLSLLVVATFAARRLVACAVLLGAVVLVRYEGWALWLGVAGWLLVERHVEGWMRRLGWSRPGEPGDEVGSPSSDEPRYARLLVVLLPLIVIVGWAAARRPFDPGWFWFLHGTRQFANEALGVRSSLERGVTQLLADLAYYPINVAWICFGYPLILVPFGVVRMVRREGARLVVPPLAILGFITYVWIQRGSLGLFRHFMVLVPLYALAAAHGLVQLGDWAAALARRGHLPWAAGRALKVAVVAGFTVAAFQTEWIHNKAWMDDWFRKGKSAFSDRRELASLLRTLPVTSRIACDEPTVEILSALDRRRFDRQPIDGSLASLARLQAEADRLGELWVASWSAKLTRLETEGEVVYPPPLVVAASPPGDKKGSGLSLVRLRARSGHASSSGVMP